jgi:hypothetical protein
LSLPFSTGAFCWGVAQCLFSCLGGQWRLSRAAAQVTEEDFTTAQTSLQQVGINLSREKKGGALILRTKATAGLRDDHGGHLFDYIGPRTKQGLYRVTALCSDALLQHWNSEQSSAQLSVVLGNLLRGVEEERRLELKDRRQKERERKRKRHSKEGS